MAGGRAVRRAQLVERLDLEAGLAQRADHLAVREVELDRGPLGVVPLDAVEAELRAREAVRGDLGAGRRAEDDQDGVGEEDESAARAQQPRGLGDPALGLAPEAPPPPPPGGGETGVPGAGGPAGGPPRPPTAGSRSWRPGAGRPRRRPRSAGTRGRAAPASPARSRAARGTG